MPLTVADLSCNKNCHIAWAIGCVRYVIARILVVDSVTMDNTVLLGEELGASCAAEGRSVCIAAGVGRSPLKGMVRGSSDEVPSLEKSMATIAFSL